jgi:hypothetical protein
LKTLGKKQASEEAAAVAYQGTRDALVKVSCAI